MVCICWCVPVSQFFFLLKLLSSVSPELVCHAIVCYSFIHKIHSPRGKSLNLQPSILLMTMSVFALNRSVTFNPLPAGEVVVRALCEGECF